MLVKENVLNKIEKGRAFIHSRFQGLQKNQQENSKRRKEEKEKKKNLKI